MEDLFRPIYQPQTEEEGTLAIFLIRRLYKVNPVTDNFDLIILMIVASDAGNWSVEHFDYKGKSIAMYSIEEGHLKTRGSSQISKRAKEWIVDGDLVFERGQYGKKVKQEITDVTIEIKERKQAIEFAKLTKSYREAQGFYETNHYLDANQAIIQTLHHLARLSIIEKGQHPELMVWKQMKKVDPEVYKLYEEFAGSEENLEERISLMMIGIEFAVTRRADSCAKHLIKIMKGRAGPWRIGELVSHPELDWYAFELSSMVEFLTNKGIIEVVKAPQKRKGVIERLYQAKKKAYPPV